MSHAIQEERCVLTRNYCDFEDLHNLLDTAKGHHSGIVVIRRDDNSEETCHLTIWFGRWASLKRREFK